MSMSKLNGAYVYSGFGRGCKIGSDAEASYQRVGQSALDPVAFSTPLTHVIKNTHVTYTDIVDSPTARLAEQAHDSTSAMHNVPSNHSSPVHAPQTCSGGCLDTSRLNVVVQSDVKPPPFFRGDHADTCTVHEWEDLMQSYLRRRKCSTADMYDAITSRLMGKARDIVKVSLRSNPDIDPYSHPAAVFDILKKNFSELPYSGMPMADFYSTLPKTDESALDYWVRLNKAIDVADECLRRRGRCVEDMSAEVVMMFVTHCPDPHLSLSFKSKPASKWSASEVQERLDDHQRDLRRRPPVCQHSPSTRSPGYVAFTQSTAQFDNSNVQPEATLHPVLHQPPAAVALPVNRAEEEPSMREVVSMLNKVITLCSVPQSVSHHRQPQQRQQLSQPPVSSPCRVCSSTDHSTFSHCRLLKLCRHCFQPGHFKSSCPGVTRPAAASAQPSRVPLN